MERWLPVVGFEDLYEVSDHGRVRSALTGKVKKETWDAVTKRLVMGFIKEGKRKTVRPGPLVLQAFVSPRPEGMECCHYDGDTRNNRLENLRWDTSKNNHADRIRHGNDCAGDKNGMAKLTWEKVRLIRQDPRSQSAIAATFGICQAQVSNIKNFKCW